MVAKGFIGIFLCPVGTWRLFTAVAEEGVNFPSVEGGANGPFFSSVEEDFTSVETS